MAGTHSDNEDDMGGLVDQTLYIEKLASLKSLRLARLGVSYLCTSMIFV